MPPLAPSLVVSGDAFRVNAEATANKLAEVRRLEQAVRDNSASRKARFEERGQLLPRERVERLLLPCGEDFDVFLSRLAGSPPELETVANLMVDGGFAHVVDVSSVGE